MEDGEITLITRVIFVCEKRLTNRLKAYIIVNGSKNYDL